MNGSNSIVTIGAMEVGQDNITGYGKINVTDKLELTADKLAAKVTTTDSAGLLARSGDMIYVYPFLATGALSGISPTDPIVINVQYLKPGFGFVEVTESLETNLETVGADAVFDKINTELERVGLDDVLEAFEVTAENAVKLQAKKKNVMFTITSADTSITFPTDTTSYLTILGIKNDFTPSTTGIESIEVIKKYDGKSTNFTASEYKELNYEVIRNIGEMTGATLNSTLDPVMYKGLSKVAKQIEYAEGSATLSCDEMAFNVDNLEYVYGWTKQKDASFTSGKTSVALTSTVYKYSFTEDTIPETVGLFGLHKKIDGGLIMFTAEASKTNSLDLSMKKTEFRTNNVEFNLMTPNSKCVWSLVSL